jgi:hypothetical protein
MTGRSGKQLVKAGGEQRFGSRIGRLRGSLGQSGSQTQRHGLLQPSNWLFRVYSGQALD